MFFLSSSQLMNYSLIVGKLLVETDSRTFFFFSAVRNFFCLFDLNITSWYVRRMVSFLYLAAFSGQKLLVVSNYSVSNSLLSMAGGVGVNLGVDIFHGKWYPGSLTNWGLSRKLRGYTVYPSIIFVLDCKPNEGFGALHESCCTGVVTIAILDGSFCRSDIWFPLPGSTTEDTKLIYFQLVLKSMQLGRVLNSETFKRLWRFGSLV